MNKNTRKSRASKAPDKPRVPMMVPAKKEVDKPQMVDSGKRRKFETGAVRDTGNDKPRFELISPLAEERLAEWLRLGSLKYSSRNWEKGIPQSVCLASAKRHIHAFEIGDVSEDHLAALMCNAMFLTHNDEAIKMGILSKELDDLPYYGRQKRMG